SFTPDNTNNSAVATACNDANESVVVSPNTPTISTTASQDIVVGHGTISDTAHLGGLVDPQTGSVTFNLYGPDDADCSGSVIFTWKKTVYRFDDYASDRFPPSVPTRRSSDLSFTPDNTNNSAVATACNDANESVVVSPNTPTISTTASQDIVVGHGTIS